MDELIIVYPNYSERSVGLMITNVSGVLETYKVYKTDEKYPVLKTGRQEDLKDTVAISDKAQDYQSVRIALANVPDVREELVAAIKMKYEANKNVVSASEIADKLIDKI